MNRSQTFVPGQSMGVEIYSTPTGMWVESADVVVHPGVQPMRVRGEAVRTRGAVVPAGRRGSYAGTFTNVDVSWEIRETAKGIELFIQTSPTSAVRRVKEIQHTGPDGKCSVRKLDTYEKYAVQELKSGDNEVAVITSQGQRLVIFVKVQSLDKETRPKHGTGQTLGQPKILTEARDVVEKHREYSLRKGRGFVPPYNGILSLGELDEIIEMAETVGADFHPDTTALILGDTGTGKELIARLVHQAWASRAAAKNVEACDVPFVACSGATLGGDPNIQISRLFGRVPGYLNQYDLGEKGYFLLACGYEWVKRGRRWELVKRKETGVLFLDEIAELLPEVQATLLRVLEGEHKAEPLGWGPVPVAPKMVFATERDISKPDLRKDINFREALWYRISSTVLRIRRLEHRRRVIPHLIYYFTHNFLTSREMIRRIDWDEEALVAMAAYSWPGNIRELLNVVSNTLLLRKSDRIQLADLPQAIQNDYEGLKQDWQEEDRQAIKTIAGLAKDMFPKAFEALEASTSQNCRDRWSRVVDSSLQSLKSWLENEHHVQGLETGERDCYSYLCTWLKDAAKARKVLAAVVDALRRNQQSMSSTSEAQHGLKLYDTFQRFFGMTYRTLST